jgi:hypothetical protein
MLADGFTTTSPEYIAAQIYFSQNPASQFVWIGAQDPSGINTLNPHSGAIGSGYVVGDVVKIIQSGATGGTAQVTSVSSSNGGVTGLALFAAGHGYAVANNLATTGGTGSGLFVDITVVLEPALLAAQACRAASSQWYAFGVTDAADSDVLALALWTEGLGFTQPTTYFFSTQDAAVLNNTAGNIAATLKAAAYKRTYGLYSTTQTNTAPNNIYAWSAAMGYAMGANTGLPASFFTMKFKTLVGIIPEPLTQSQVTSIENLNINLYLTYGNAFTWQEQGVTPSGQFFDQTLNLDVLVATLQYNVLALLVSTPSIPMTDPGETQLLQAVNQAASASALIGFIGPGVWAGPTISLAAGSPGLQAGQSLPQGYWSGAPSYATQSATARAARQAQPIYLAIIEAEAVHSILIGVYVQH